MLRFLLETFLFRLAWWLAFLGSFAGIYALGDAFAPPGDRDARTAILVVAALLLSLVPASLVTALHCRAISNRITRRTLRGRGGKLPHRKGI